MALRVPMTTSGVTLPGTIRRSRRGFRPAGVHTRSPMAAWCSQRARVRTTGVRPRGAQGSGT